MRLRLLVGVLLGACLFALTGSLPTDAQSREPFSFPPPPVRGDCRDYPGQACTWDAWTGETTVSPKIIRAGESVSVSVVLLPGGVSYTIPGIYDSSNPDAATNCTHEEEIRRMPVQVDGRGPTPTSR